MAWRNISRAKIFSALHFSSTGAYVSGTVNNPNMPKKAEIINVSHAVHLHPRWLAVTYSPTIGPAIGPMKTAPENPAVAIPRSITPQKSTYVPPTMAMGAVEIRN